MDYIIKNGWIVNGKNEKPFYGDLAVKNGKIEEVGEHIGAYHCGKWKLRTVCGASRGEV